MERSGSPLVRALVEREAAERASVAAQEGIAVTLLGARQVAAAADDEHLALVVGLIRAAARRDHAEETIRTGVAAARSVGVPWRSIGPAIGLTGEGARARYSERGTPDRPATT